MNPADCMINPFCRFGSTVAIGMIRCDFGKMYPFSFSKTGAHIYGGQGCGKMAPALHASFGSESPRTQGIGVLFLVISGIGILLD